MLFNLHHYHINQWVCTQQGQQLDHRTTDLYNLFLYNRSIKAPHHVTIFSPSRRWCDGADGRSLLRRHTVYRVHRISQGAIVEEKQ